VWEILPDLFLGDRSDAFDRKHLLARGISHVVNCSRELPCHFEGEFCYLWLRLEDPDPHFAGKIPELCGFIDEGRRVGKVMVHCTGGVSRSPAVILAYLCHLEGSLERAAEILRKAVPTGIDDAFLHQMAQVQGTPLSKAELKVLQNKLLGRG
jgi:protein-tyrosine phosphatase